MSGLTMTSRAVKMLSGAAAIFLSIASFIFSTLTIVFLITLLTFAIMIVGLSRIVVGYSEKERPTWLRWGNILGGGIAFFFGFVAAIFSDLGFYALRLMLSCVFIVLGLIRIAAASKGELT